MCVSVRAVAEVTHGIPLETQVKVGQLFVFEGIVRPIRKRHQWKAG